MNPKNLQRILDEWIRKEYNGVAWREAFIKKERGLDSYFDYNELNSLTSFVAQKVEEETEWKVSNTGKRKDGMSASALTAKDFLEWLSKYHWMSDGGWHKAAYFDKFANKTENYIYRIPVKELEKLKKKYGIK